MLDDFAQPKVNNLSVLSTFKLGKAKLWCLVAQLY